ncbi:MAG: hypothetical protein ACP5IA_01995 [Sediminispirochaetaceae bacterium]
MNSMLRGGRFFPVAVLVLVWLCLPFRASAEYLQFGRDIFVNMPASWQVDGLEETKFSAVNRAEEAFLLVKYRGGGEFDGIDVMYDYYLGELQAESLGRTGFSYSGSAAEVGTIQFPHEGMPHTGYLLCIETLRIDLVAVAFAREEHFASYQDVLLSALDSLSIGESGLMSPGPISQSVSPYPDPEREIYSIRYGDVDIPLAISRRAIQASQELIEREARVLVVYAGTPYAEEAWQRYYRIIYRDIYRRCRPIYGALRQYLPQDELGPREIAEELLRWVQSFEYRRLATVSDCLTPLQAAVDHAGDCDSRGLLLTIMLHYYGIDAILMVSGAYAHSMAAVDVPGNGARFEYNGTAYLVAETTDQVEIGLIDQAMADPNGWIGVDFINTRILSGE